MQSWTFLMFTVSEKIARLKFLPLTDSRITDHHVGSDFSCKSETLLYITTPDSGPV